MRYDYLSPRHQLYVPEKLLFFSSCFSIPRALIFFYIMFVYTSLLTLTSHSHSHEQQVGVSPYQVKLIYQLFFFSPILGKTST